LIIDKEFKIAGDDHIRFQNEYYPNFYAGLTIQFKATMKTCYFLMLLNFLINQYINIFFYLAADLLLLNIKGEKKLLT
jgi:hypothetical protein